MPKYCKFYSECKKIAVYQIPHSKLSLCKAHFLKNVEKRVKKIVEKKHMFHPDRGEKLLVAASGGKDSQVLLSIIKKLYPENLNVEAIYVELGIKEKGYSKNSGTIAQKLCQKLSIPFHSINIEEDYGFTIDSIYNLKKTYKEKKLVLEKNPFKGECSYCGTFKRYVINKFASENKFSAVATGHNLTDEATQLINNFFNMDLNYMAHSGPILNADIETLIPRVKPLFYISEDEIVMYAYYAKIEHFEAECPFSIHVPNGKLKQIIKEIEEYRRGNTISLLRQYQKHMKPVILKSISSSKKSENVCKICGQPTFARKCSFCKMVETLKKRFQIANTS